MGDAAQGRTVSPMLRNKESRELQSEKLLGDPESCKERPTQQEKEQLKLKLVYVGRHD